jgi:hypothetical protein
MLFSARQTQACLFLFPFSEDKQTAIIPENLKRAFLTNQTTNMKRIPPSYLELNDVRLKKVG